MKPFIGMALASAAFLGITSEGYAYTSNSAFQTCILSSTRLLPPFTIAISTICRRRDQNMNFESFVVPGLFAVDQFGRVVGRSLSGGPQRPFENCVVTTPQVNFGIRMEFDIVCRGDIDLPPGIPQPGTLTTLEVDATNIDGVISFNPSQPLIRIR